MAKSEKKPGLSGIPDPSVRVASPPLDTIELRGKKVLVVGGTGGIGRALARLMAARGAEVTVVGQTFRDAGRAGIDFLRADLSRMSEARRVGRTVAAEALDLVVLTTGIFAAPKRQTTEEGLERDLAVSYLSRLALLRELAPRLGRGRPPGAPRPRVFVMGFPGTGEAGDPDDLNAERSYAPLATHMNTVAGNEALVLYAVRRYPQAGFFGLNPGLIQSDIRANLLGPGSFKHRAVEALIGLFSISAQTYAERLVPVLFAPELEGRSGVMFDRKARAILPSAALTPQRVAALISASEALLARVAPPPGAEAVPRRLSRPSQPSRSAESTLH